MQPYILYFHSILRYFILISALIVAAQSLIGMMGKKEFKKGNRMFALFLLIFCDLQLVLGLFLYYWKVIEGKMFQIPGFMKDPDARFWAVEHIFCMLTGIILVHIGYVAAKKNIDNEKKFKRVFWYVFVALCLFVAKSPWDGVQAGHRPNFREFPHASGNVPPPPADTAKNTK